MARLKWKRQHLQSCVLEIHRKWQYEYMCQDIIYTIPPSLESIFFLDNDKWPWWNTKKRTVTSIIAPLCSLPVIVSWTKEGMSERQQRHFFLFPESSAGVAIRGFWAWWQEAKEDWVGPKRKDQFQSSWSRDPRAQRESLRESQPSV